MAKTGSSSVVRIHMFNIGRTREKEITIYPAALSWKCSCICICNFLKLICRLHWRVGIVNIFTISVFNHIYYGIWKIKPRQQSLQGKHWPKGIRRHHVILHCLYHLRTRNISMSLLIYLEPLWSSKNFFLIYSFTLWSWIWTWSIFKASIPE